MRNTFLFMLLVLVSFASCNQTNKSTVLTKDSVVNSDDIVTIDSAGNQLASVVNAFVEAYAHKSNSAVNALLHPDLGLTIIYRPGVSDTFIKMDSIDFSKPMPDYYGYPSLKNDFPLTYGKLPEFDCGTEKWNKLGLYVDSTDYPKQLRNIVAFENEFEPNKYTKKSIDTIRKGEKDSHRVILTTAHPLVFHVQKYQGKWYVTVLDRAYAGCDA